MAANKMKRNMLLVVRQINFGQHGMNNIWKDKNELLNKTVIGRQVTKQDRDIISLFEEERFFRVNKDFYNFEVGKKKICRYQQYFAVKAMLERIKHDKKRWSCLAYTRFW